MSNSVLFLGCTLGLAQPAQADEPQSPVTAGHEAPRAGATASRFTIAGAAHSYVQPALEFGSPTSTRPTFVGGLEASLGIGSATWNLPATIEATPTKKDSATVGVAYGMETGRPTVDGEAWSWFLGGQILHTVDQARHSPGIYRLAAGVRTSMDAQSQTLTKPNGKSLRQFELQFSEGWILGDNISLGTRFSAAIGNRFVPWRFGFGSELLARF